MVERRLRLVVIGATLDGTDVGESLWSFRLTEALSRATDLTVLSSARPGRKPLSEQLPLAEVVTWPEPAFLSRHFERLNAMAAPTVPLFFWQSKRWLRNRIAAGRQFDILHQMVPMAMRFSAPWKRLGIPYVMGPLGGGLATPEAFRHEVRESMATRLRDLDHYRLTRDPWLRDGYANAAAVIGVAPYIRDKLDAARIPVQRFEAILEPFLEGARLQAGRTLSPGHALRLLHVGRAIRTKGLRDVIRALSHLRDLPGITLTSAGDGPDLAACRAEAEALGVADRVTFLGKTPRAEVETLYATHDVFAFPSFREPMGGVVFEALNCGLPIIAARRGGPDVILDDTCALKIEVTTPERLAIDIAQAVRRLSADTALRQSLSDGALARIRGFGTWDDKVAEFLALYHDILSGRNGSAVDLPGLPAVANDLQEMLRPGAGSGATAQQIER